MIGGLLNKKFISPFTFQGGCNNIVFNVWLEHVLFPNLPNGAVIVLDNATFHKTAETKLLVQKYGFQILFLPTYSPDLNPIENCWHTLKSRLRPLIQTNPLNFQGLIGQCLLTL